MPTNNKPEDSDNLFRKEEIVVICPYRELNKIFNKEDYEVKDLGFVLEDKRVILILKKVGGINN